MDIQHPRASAIHTSNIPCRHGHPPFASRLFQQHHPNIYSAFRTNNFNDYLFIKFEKGVKKDIMCKHVTTKEGVASNDYALKSCIFVTVVDLWIAGRYTHHSI
jgi:hypothetical protein